MCDVDGVVAADVGAVTGCYVYVDAFGYGVAGVDVGVDDDAVDYGDAYVDDYDDNVW